MTMADWNSMARALAMIVAFALLIAGIAAIRHRNRTQGWLMIVVALMLVGNVMIWTLPIG